MGIKLSEPEAFAVADFFTMEGPNIQPPQDVSYKKFCECVDECFGVLARLESQPDAPIPRPGEAVPRSFTPAPVSDMEKLDHVLHRVALLTASRGVVLKYCFQDFERGDATSLTVPRRCGKCTAEQFKRCFPFTKDFENDEIELLMDHYTTQNGDIHFQQLHDDVIEHGSTEPPTFPKSELVLRPDYVDWSQQNYSVVQKVQAKVVEIRVPLVEHFQDFDPLRKGFCTIGQVKTVFSLLKLNVDQADFDQLAALYSREDGQFCYAAFCNEVDQAFTENGLERQPLTQVQQTSAETTLPARRNRMSLSHAQQEACFQLEERIRARVHTRRILMKTAFRDFDPINRGHITKGQFSRVMRGLGFELDENAISLLCMVYCDFGNHIEFNYVDFCNNVDGPNEEDALSMKQIQSAYSYQAPSKYFN